MKAPWFISGSIFLAVISLPFLQQILRFADWVATSLLLTFLIGTVILVAFAALGYNIVMAIKEGITNAK